MKLKRGRISETPTESRENIKVEVDFPGAEKVNKRIQENIEWFFGDPEVVRALGRCRGDYPFPPSEVRKVIVARKPKSKRGASANVEFSAESKSIRFNVSSAVNAEKEVKATLRGILNEPPIAAEITRRNTEMSVNDGQTLKQLLDERFKREGGFDGLVARAMRNVTWEDFRPDEFSGGRSITIRLPRNVRINGRMYKAIKIKGVTYKGFMQARAEPYVVRAQKGFEFMNNIKTATMRVGDDNRIKIIDVKKPKGGCMRDECENEFDIGVETFLSGDNIDVPFLAGRLPELVYEEEDQGFVAHLVPELKIERMERKMIDRLHAASKRIRTSAGYDKNGGEVGVRFEIEEAFYGMGKALRRLHDQGYYPGFPHHANSVEENRDYFWGDMASAVRMPDDELKQITYRITDLKVAVDHFEQMGVAELDFQKMMLQIGAHPMQAFLEGYFHDRMKDGLPHQMAEHQRTCTGPASAFCPHNLRNMVRFGRMRPLDDMMEADLDQVKTVMAFAKERNPIKRAGLSLRVAAGRIMRKETPVTFRSEPGNEFVYMMRDIMHPERMARFRDMKNTIGIFVLPFQGPNVGQKEVIREACGSDTETRRAIRELEAKGWDQVNILLAEKQAFNKVFENRRALVIGLPPNADPEQAKAYMLQSIERASHMEFEEAA